ncbi:transcriptional repressor [Agreia pratensis]|uniref:Fur family transcriptional regulator, ferric uptake regulator n=1 Tax=Agreia pratensis TaxID=150121 RepID=A0A1X7HZR9_9MICO|nr:Fur family transcriptional regulator [Agreia pratensis]MBF4633624.1 transcriptional repressor [Agreia pratensis]SMG07509.1 Fur family transcriptional regulator, ferric uptake regulator [Agreia pratensis]
MTTDVTDAAALADSIRSVGLKVTEPRVAVLDVIEREPHIDAERIFQSIRTSLPGTSVQAVHGVLAAFSQAGLLRRIEPAHSPALYERRVDDNHHHIVCSACGAVEDVDCAVGHSPCLVPSSASGFQVQSAEVNFWGLCPNCQTG